MVAFYVKVMAEPEWLQSGSAFYSWKSKDDQGTIKGVDYGSNSRICRAYYLSQY